MMNKNILIKTKKNLIKINIIVVASFLVLFSTFIYFYFKGITYNGLDNKLERELEAITLQLSRSSFINPIVIDDPRNMVYVYEGDRVRYYTQNRYFENSLPNKNDNKKEIFYTYTTNGYTFRELKVDIGRYTIQIIRNIDSEISSLRDLIFVFIMGIFIATVMTYFIAIYLTKKALVPIEIAWSNQAKFIQDASHELRTPISIISSKLESMLKVPNNTVTDEVETIASAMQETRRLKKMISDLLTLTKEDAIEKVQLEDINLEELIREISKNYIDIAEMQEKDFSIVFNLNNKIICTDKNKLRQLILIFIDNAFKYTEKGDIITVILKESNYNTIIAIKDSGVGIKEEEVPFIFDRFFRSENVRNKDIDGSGIGLSIANMICINLGYNINVRSKLNIGTEFEIILKEQ